MSKQQKAKTSKGVRNDERKNGKAWKKNPVAKRSTKKTWEQRCEERRIRRAGKQAA